MQVHSSLLVHPQSRISYVAQLSKDAQRRVHEAAPSGSRCLVENCPNERAVEFAHIVGRRFSERDDYINAIEWYWNMRKGTLNVNNRYNVICLGASLHRLLDTDHWALLPPPHIVAQYEATLVVDSVLWPIPVAHRSTFPQIPNGIYNYRLFPIHDMHSFGITRQQDTSDSPDANNFTTYVYPFDLLPVLPSHVHPKFAILELGRKLSTRREQFRNYQGPHLHTLQVVLKLYNAWTAIPPIVEESASYKAFSDSDDDDDDNGPNDADDQTKNLTYGSKKAKSNKSAQSKGTEPRRASNQKRRRAESPTRKCTTGAHERTEDEQRRVLEAAPSGSRCLVENCPNERAVEFAQIVGRPFSERDVYMRTIEWYWNMRKGTLDLNSRYNVICLGASLHRLLDTDHWALLPPPHIIAQYDAALVVKSMGGSIARRSTFPQIPNGIYNYSLFPIRYMHSFGITRQQTTDTPDANSFTTYLYPFNLFPVLPSHVHPKFAILALGRKLSIDTERLSNYQGPHLATLNAISRLYSAWTAMPPDEDSASYKAADTDDDDSDSGPDNADDQKKDPSYGKKAGSNKSAQSKGTEPRRVSTQKRRRVESSTRKRTTGARERAEKCGTSLSHKTLVQHERQVGKGGWTAENVSAWRQQLVDYV